LEVRGLHRLQTETLADNAPTIRVARNVGFAEDGRRRDSACSSSPARHGVHAHAGLRERTQDKLREARARIADPAPVTADLTITVKTVEAVLTRACAKLNVRTRAELAATWRTPPAVRPPDGISDRRTALPQAGVQLPTVTGQINANHRGDARAGRRLSPGQHLARARSHRPDPLSSIRASLGFSLGGGRQR
jgi:hypothetical protein